MKSRTSLFNPPAFKKDITRFAPAWVLYTVGMLMMLTVCLTESQEYYRATNLVDSLSFMASFNLCYGLLNAQLLFGDLFNARHCNALHAMPLRRECWFTTHVVSGLLFSLVPNLVTALISMITLGGGWSVALWWLLAVTLQYIFFFGVAVCSALCVGNRFAMVLVYGIVNFFALIVYWFFYSIYQPLLYGVYGLEEQFLWWCPAWQMMEHYDLIEVVRREVETSLSTAYYVQSVSPGAGWGYLAGCAVLGAVLLGAALALYRRRKLESAGDFMAVKGLEPVFLVLYTLCAAAFFQLFANLFGTLDYVFLPLGLIVGFFTGRMLLMRTTRVFQGRAFLHLAILAAVFIGSMVLTALDPLGITRRIPDTDQVRTACLNQSYYSDNSQWPALSSDADIDAVRALHQAVLDGEIDTALEDEDDAYYTSLHVSYVLDNGSTMNRQYSVACDSPAGEMMAAIMTQPEYVLGTADTDALLKNLGYVFISRFDEEKEEYGQVQLDEAFLRGLMDAILADCAEGTMAQPGGFHEYEEFCWVEFETIGADGLHNYRQVNVYADCRHTIAYLTETEIPYAE